MIEFVQSLSIIIASIVAIYGINAWRRELRGKKEIDLAEEVLALFYESRDKIQYIRHPAAGTGEGSSRERADNEIEAEAEILDNAYVVFERFNKVEETFNKLKSLKYRFMAFFGSDTSEFFDELTKLLNEIMFAARILGTHYWKRQGRIKMEGEAFERHLKEMHQFEAIFWAGAENPDKFAERVEHVIAKVESVCSTALKSPEPFWAKAHSLYKEQRKL